MKVLLFTCISWALVLGGLACLILSKFVWQDLVESYPFLEGVGSIAFLAGMGILIWNLRKTQAGRRADKRAKSFPGDRPQPDRED